MRTFISTLALVASASVFAQSDAAMTQQPEPAPFEQSIYEECLLIAGQNSWDVLKLNDDQVARMTDLQARYKVSAQEAKEQALAEEKAAAKGKGKVAQAPKAITPIAKQEQVTNTAEAMEQEQAAPVPMEEKAEMESAMTTDGTLVNDGDVSAANPAEIIEVSYSPIDAELRSILTPEQLLIWERRCDRRTSMTP